MEKKIETRGGARLNTGPKSRGLTANRHSIQRGDEEMAAFLARGKSAYVRYLIRKDAGCCLHPIQSVEEDGTLKCSDCGAINPEVYGQQE